MIAVGVSLGSAYHIVHANLCCFNLKQEWLKKKKNFLLLAF